jgi:hypothetical protein
MVTKRNVRFVGAALAALLSLAACGSSGDATITATNATASGTVSVDRSAAAAGLVDCDRRPVARC